MNRFLSAEDFKVGDRLRLSPEESHHLVKVLRTSLGEKILVINGRGLVAEAEVLEAAARSALVGIEKLLPAETPRSRVHLCFAIPKPAALDFLVHRCTELGVAAFQPLVTAHSAPAKHWNEARWQRVVQEVCKQCEAPFFPDLKPVLSLEKWLAERDPGFGMILCDESKREAEPLSFLASTYVLIGAEGGWQAAETELLRGAGAVSMGLGKNRLRAETAALTSVVLAKRLLGEL